MKYKLTKMSAPGWTFTTKHKHLIASMLKSEVCGSCTSTKNQFMQRVEEREDCVFGIEEQDLVEQNINPFTFTDFFPEDFTELSVDDKIMYYLSTACGCEYDYEEEEDGE